MKSNGWIALDIDGTITLDKYSVPKPVVEYLRKLEGQGWRIAVATGRSLHFALMALSEFSFPYLILPQNGSSALTMPEKKVLFRRYLPWEAIALIDEAFQGISSHFTVYTERDCYFRPKRFGQESWPLIQAWQERQKEKWIPLEQFNRELIPQFALAKCFGPFQEMATVATRLRVMHRFQVALMRDPFGPDAALLLITDAKASKGQALTAAIEQLGRGACVIAAGDDENDLSLLQAADIKIAMPHAPESLRNMADFLAPPTKEYGIIDALKRATHHGA